MTFPILNHLGLEELGIPFIGEGAGSMQFSGMRYYVLIAAILLALTLLLIQKIESSRLGFALKALKQNETAAEGMGIDTYRAKMTAFMLASAIAAIGGTLYAVSILYVLTTHAVFGLFIIVRILGITIVGGMGTLWGPVIAAAILVPLGEFLNAQFGARLPGVQDVVYGAALVISIIYIPEGIWGRIAKALREYGYDVVSSHEIGMNAEVFDSQHFLPHGQQSAFDSITRGFIFSRGFHTCLRGGQGFPVNFPTGG